MIVQDPCRGLAPSGPRDLLIAARIERKPVLISQRTHDGRDAQMVITSRRNFPLPISIGNLGRVGGAFRFERRPSPLFQTSLAGREETVWNQRLDKLPGGPLPLRAASEKGVFPVRTGYQNLLAMRGFRSPIGFVLPYSAQEIVFADALLQKLLNRPGSQPKSDIPVFDCGFVTFLQLEILTGVLEAILAR